MRELVGGEEEKRVNMGTCDSAEQELGIVAAGMRDVNDTAAAEDLRSRGSRRKDLPGVIFVPGLAAVAACYSARLQTELGLSLQYWQRVQSWLLS